MVSSLSNLANKGWLKKSYQPILSSGFFFNNFVSKSLLSYDTSKGKVKLSTFLLISLISSGILNPKKGVFPNNI